MARKLKVYGGNYGGRHRAIMACSSMAEFMRATGIGRDYMEETGNAAEIAQAMSDPGQPFIQPMSLPHSREWLPLALRDRPTTPAAAESARSES